MRTRHRPILLFPFIVALAAGCGEDAGAPTGPEVGPSLAAGTRVITISPSSNPVSFGAIAPPFGPANSTTQTFTVTNVGARATSALSLAITGTGAAAYRIEPGDDRCTGRSLTTSGKNKSCTVKVTFAPAAGGVFTASLSVTVAQPKTTVSVNLSGAGRTEPATIRIIAQVVGTDVSTSYDLCGVPFPNGGTSCMRYPLLSGEDEVISGVGLGAWWLTAADSPAGYHLQSIVCTEAGPDGYTNVASTVDLSIGRVYVDLQAGETLTCTFTTAQSS